MDNDVKGLLREAWRLRGQGNYTEALEAVHRAHSICGDQDYEALGRIYHVYMQFEYDRDDCVTALELCKKSLAYYHISGNQDRIAHSSRHVGDLLRELGRLDESEGLYRSALALYRREPGTTKGDLANCLRSYGLLLEAMEKTNRAMVAYLEARDLYDDIGLSDGVVELTGRLDTLS